MKSNSKVQNFMKMSLFGGVRYEEFEMPKHGYDKMGGNDDRGWAGDAQTLDADSPESEPDIERPPLRHIDKYVRAECPCLSKRYTIALMTCMGFIISFGMRCNMSMAKNKIKHGAIKYNWTLATDEVVDSSFFWGYLVTQVPGGLIASLFPANQIFGAAIACSTFLNLMLPSAIEDAASVIVIVRVLQGLVEGVTYPACHGIWRFWAPPLERSRLATMAFCGTYAGVVIGMPLAGVLISVIGWQAPFYFYGIIGLIWYCFWLWLTFERPRDHPCISIQELKYIEKSLGETTQVAMPSLKTTPWNKFFTSLPVYAIIVANFCRSWNFYLLVLFQAKYLQDVFEFSIGGSGFIGALPHLLMTCIVPIGGQLADYLRRTKILTTTAVRKLFNCGGFGMEGLFFLVVAFSGDPIVANTALCFGVAFSGFAISGYNVNHLDIAPRYASILMGMSNGIGTIAGMLCPVVVDHITHKGTPENWKKVFIIAACIHFVGITFYGIFASGELQEWAEPTVEEQQSWGTAEPVVPGDVQKETTFANRDPSSQASQLNQKSVNYGAVEQVAGHPFAYANHVAEEVQPEARDEYMHGTVNDRTY